MLRLLQGDVGSGKTVVALMAMAIARRGRRPDRADGADRSPGAAALETIAPLAEEAGLRVGLLTGREKGKARAALLRALAEGEIDILIGTHALFQPEVVFKDLAFAVIDEQHRFGVHQRLALQTKGGKGGANVLVMTATPIPRTLLMTHYGDLDVSRLTEKPAGRKPIDTQAIPVEAIERLIDRLSAQLAEGAQVYWVCPLIESSETSELAAAEERARASGAAFRRRASRPAARRHERRGQGRDHGRVLRKSLEDPGGDHRDRGRRRRAERQHHDHRARRALWPRPAASVARTRRPRLARKLLHAVARRALGEIAAERLAMMCKTDDGFLIAEKDLELRGGGEVLGARQCWHAGVPRRRRAGLPGSACRRP